MKLIIEIGVKACYKSTSTTIDNNDATRQLPANPTNKIQSEPNNRQTNENSTTTQHKPIGSMTSIRCELMLNNSIPIMCVLLLFEKPTQLVDNSINSIYGQ